MKGVHIFVTDGDGKDVMLRSDLIAYAIPVKAPDGSEVHSAVKMEDGSGFHIREEVDDIKALIRDARQREAGF